MHENIPVGCFNQLLLIFYLFQSFGVATNEVITLNLPKGSSLDFAIIVKCCLCLALFFTYPGTLEASWFNHITCYMHKTGENWIFFSVMMFPVVSILEKKFLPVSDAFWQGVKQKTCSFISRLSYISFSV